MIRTVHLAPLIPDWISYQLDEETPDAPTGWRCVAARPRAKNQAAGEFSVGAEFSDTAERYRVVWVGLGGSKNMVITDPQPIDQPRAQIVGGLRVSR